MTPLSCPARTWTVLARTEVEDRGDVRSGFEEAGTAVVSVYPKIVTVARTEDGLVTDRRLDAYVVARSDISPGDRMESPEGSVWSVVSAWPTTGGCTLELARVIE